MNSAGLGPVGQCVSAGTEDAERFGEEEQRVEAAPDHGGTGRSVMFTPEEAPDLRDHAHGSGETGRAVAVNLLGDNPRRDWP